MYPSSSSYVTYVTVGVNCHTCHKSVPTMAPKKRLGVGAECTVSLRFLHPKDKIAEKIPNLTKSQKLSVLVVQERMEKSIRHKETQCVMFRHEDFSGQLDRIPSTTPGAEPPRDAKDSGSARSHSTHLETSSSNRP